MGLLTNAAILDNTMSEQPASAKQQQALAHSRGRICKVKGCKVCAPLREDRRLKKAQRKADAQAQHHEKGEPCGRNNCAVPVCVEARDAKAVTSAPTMQRRDESTDDPSEVLRRQAERHRAGLPCRSEGCPRDVCAEGFAQERARRHRAGRPCPSAECDNPVCVSSRSVT